MVTTALSPAYKGALYRATLEAYGGRRGLVWSISEGALPSGFMLEPETGEIGGTPTGSETASFTVRVASPDGQTAARDLSLEVKLSCWDLETADVSFVDVNMEASVRSALGLSASDPLSCAAFADAEDLYAQYLDPGIGDPLLSRDYAGPIEDLSGVENLTGLRLLFLGPHPLTEIAPIARLDNLETVRLVKIPFTDLSPFAHMRNLTELRIYQAATNDLSPLSDVTQLEVLRLSGLYQLPLPGTYIQDLGPLSGLQNLWFLSIEGNWVTDLGPLSGLTGLTHLDLGYSFKITDVEPLRGLTELELLDLSGALELADIQPLLDNRVWGRATWWI